MTGGSAELRAAAARVAKGLLQKGQASDAVEVLAAWAANGPNDAAGQSLLAEALRIDPASQIAKQAFERMEGIPGQYAPLEGAVARWSTEEVARAERELTRPAFFRAQVGFNNNVKYRNQTFHIQTEDSGLDKPHVITHLFADGGRVIKGHKRSYADQVRRDDIAIYVRQLMKAQQLEMALGLREGKFDAIIEGRGAGGLELLDDPPRVDLQRLATQKRSRVQADGFTDAQQGPDAPAPPLASSPPVAPPAQSAAAIGASAEPQFAVAPAPPFAEPQFAVVSAPPTVSAIAAASAAAMPVAPLPRSQPALCRLTVVRSLGGGPAFYEPAGPEAIIGSAGTIVLAGERFCHPREAALRRREGRLWLQDLEQGSGVFFRIRTPVELAIDDEFIVGDQLLRIERNPPPRDHPEPGPTYFYSSPKWVSSFRVVQVFEGGALGACVLARGTTLQIGSSYGDFVFPSDPLVSDQHCLIEETAGAILLTDLGSRTGVFVRIQGEQELVPGDELLVGRTRLMVS